jgi:peptidyl-prolyl cis-trans isomerase C
MKITLWLRAMLHEPLVHFLLAGMAVFVFFTWRGTEVDPASRTITISEEQVERLTASWTQTWQRQPSLEEIDGLIRDYIKDEIYTREALRLGLDQDDIIIRRRLRSKMEFMATSQLENAPADDATLQTWLNKNSTKYAIDSKFSFDQVYLKAADEGAVRLRSAALLKRLARGADWTDIGDPISLPSHMENVIADDIKREFGNEFAASLIEQKSPEWVGPIASGFGFHLVRLRNVEVSGLPRLKDVRQQVENDWRSATLRVREAKAYQLLLDSYSVNIEKP